MLNISNIFTQSKHFYHSVGVLGVPFCLGQTKRGVDIGPAVLRQSGLLQELQEYLPKLKLKDYGDVKYEPNKITTKENLKNWSHVTACNYALSNNVKKIVEDNSVCLTLGGDHSIGLGSIDGHARALKNKDMAVLWIDAHADINTSKSSPTGNCHGMPLAFLVKEMQQLWTPLPGLQWQTPKISIQNIAYIGLRSVDQFERDILHKYGVAAYNMDDVERYGIHTVIKMALNKIDPYSNRSLHVSFDIDSLDVLEAPSTGTPVRGGLSLREGIIIMEAVHKTNRMQVMDLVEVNPEIGTDADVKITVDAAKQIILAAFGCRLTRSDEFNTHITSNS